MKRTLILVAAFLALGALINFAAAVSCCLWTQGPLLSLLDRVEDWPHPVDASWERWTEEVQYRRASGLYESSAIGEKEGEWRLEQGKQYYFESGLPCLSFRRTLWREESRIEKTPLDAREPERLHEGLLVAGLALALNAERTIIPLTPIWPGFAWGTAFYAAIAALIAHWLKALIATLRAPTQSKQSPHSFRWALIAACFGIGTTIALSWLRINEAPRSSGWWEAPEGTPWPCPVPASWPTPELRVWESGGDDRRFRADRLCPSPNDNSPQLRETFEVQHSAAGWPLPTLSYSLGTVQVIDDEARNIVSSSNLDLSPLRRGLHIPSWRLARDLHLPLWPAFPGFLLNTLFFAALISGAFHLVASAHTMFHRRHNLCPHCSYSRAGLAPDSPCPECGGAANSAPTS